MFRWLTGNNLSKKSLFQDYPKVITYIWGNKKLRVKQLIDTNIERVDFGDNETFKSWNGVKIVLTSK